ncbi:MAG TPA: VOC family protein [Candidatus Dormibacteraeota bacterium]|nr:VOC family protein [Candidatus Dormibacteraeota bacterium]
MIKEIAFVAYPAKDVAALRDWYHEHLGIVFHQSMEEGGVVQFAESKIGDGYFSLMNHEWMHREPGSASGIAFEVDDLNATLAELRSQGMTIEDPYDTPVCRITTANDPEGNSVMLHQITVPH